MGVLRIRLLFFFFSTASKWEGGEKVPLGTWMTKKKQKKTKLEFLKNLEQ